MTTGEVANRADREVALLLIGVLAGVLIGGAGQVLFERAKSYLSTFKAAPAAVEASR